LNFGEANDLYYTLTKSQKEADRQRPPASFCSDHQQNKNPRREWRRFAAILFLGFMY
jgi:hypothetical protein